MQDIALSCQEIVKDFARTRAVDRLSLEVPRGRVFGLLGPNGSGKTTTIRIALGINEPDAGRVVLLGSDDPLAVRRRVGYLPEERGLYPKMKAAEQLAFLGAIRGLSGREAKQRALQWLERLGLAERADANTDELSKGMQQKVQFAAAFIHEPELVVLDEPFSGLDPVNTRLLKDMVLERRDAGTTVILSTHRMDQVEQMCESLVLIHRGRAVIGGTLAEVKKRHGSGTAVVEYDGAADFDGLPGVREVRDSGRTARFVLEGDADSQALLRALLDRAVLRAFRLEEPSVEDIFIDMVQEGAQALAGGSPAEAA